MNLLHGLEDIDKDGWSLLEQMGSNMDEIINNFIANKLDPETFAERDVNGEFQKQLDALYDEGFDYFPEFDDLTFIVSEYRIEGDTLILPIYAWCTRGFWDYSDGQTHSFGNWEETLKIETCRGDTLKEHTAGELEEIPEVFSFLVKADAKNYSSYECYEINCRSNTFFENSGKEDYYVMATVHI